MNMLIHGDNLDALKNLQETHGGMVKCAYLDPPYNTRFNKYSYDDSLDSDLWLGCIVERVKIIHSLLSDEGSLWLSIDHNECHYIKIAIDKVFGRNNFVSHITWERNTSPQNNCKLIANTCETLLVWCKDKKKDKGSLFTIPRNHDRDKHDYKQEDNVGLYRTANAQRLYSSESRNYEIKFPCGRCVKPKVGYGWKFSKEESIDFIKNGMLFFFNNKSKNPALKYYLKDVQQHTVAKNLWALDEVGGSLKAYCEQKYLFGDDWFRTAKPEKLMHRILTLATHKDDIVLDTFAGSGTMGAVAHKMGRRWIMIEKEDHCLTHIKPRIDKVIAGEQGGVSKECGWAGGGGYEFIIIEIS